MLKKEYSGKREKERGGIKKKTSKEKLDKVIYKPLPPLGISLIEFHLIRRKFFKNPRLL